MSDGEHRRPVWRQLCEPLSAALSHRGQRLSTRRCTVRQAASPGIDGLAAQILPAPALPFAEMQFLQPRFDENVFAQPGGKSRRPPRRACHHPVPACKPMQAQRGGLQRILFAIEIEAAVTKPRFALRLRMADKDEAHAGV